MNNYTFQHIAYCNICGSNSSEFKILGKRLNQSQGKKPKKKFGITTSIVRCKKCALIFSNPMPIPIHNNDHYGTLPKDYWKEDYFKLDDNYFSAQVENLKKIIDFKTGIKTLDIGAGIGLCMAALEKQGCESYGLESSETFYKEAIEKMGINPDRLTLTTIEEANYPENFFDFINFGSVLEHLYDPSEAINKTMKWLKPKGVMHIEVPNSDWFVSKLTNTYYKLTGTDYVANLSPMHPPYHLYEFSLKSFLEHSKRFNYEIVDYRFYVNLSYMPKIIDIFIRPYMRWTNTGMLFAVWLKKHSSVSQE